MKYLKLVVFLAVVSASPSSGFAGTGAKNSKSKAASTQNVRAPSSVPRVEIFKTTLTSKDWRVANLPQQNPFGFEHVVMRKIRPNDFVAFGFRSPGTLAKPKAVGCELELKRQAEDKTVKSVKSLGPVGAWNCLIETTNSTGTKQYYGIRVVDVKAKNRSVPFELYFSSQGALSEKEVRDVLKATAFSGEGPRS